MLKDLPEVRLLHDYMKSVNKVVFLSMLERFKKIEAILILSSWEKGVFDKDNINFLKSYCKIANSPNPAYIIKNLYFY